ncbi:MAG: hypothetical protein LBF91_06840 [Azoarcus sp.]|jgi:hypothetical protein|nr:hypothetical protein [Azoarcus sp.]
MRARKCLLFLLVLSIVFAAFPNSVAMAFAATAGDGAHTMENCQGTLAGHTDRHGDDAASPGQHDRHDTDSPQTRHDCCISFVGLISPPPLSPPVHGAQEPLLFRPSLRLAPHMTDIYRPPRQHT